MLNSDFNTDSNKNVNETILINCVVYGNEFSICDFMSALVDRSINSSECSSKNFKEDNDTQSTTSSYISMCFKNYNG